MVGADPQRLGVDELDRQLLLRQHSSLQEGARKNGGANAKHFGQEARIVSSFRRGAQWLKPRQLLSASPAAFGLSSRFCGLPRGTASLARARR